MTCLLNWGQNQNLFRVIWFQWQTWSTRRFICFLQMNPNFMVHTLIVSVASAHNSRAHKNSLFPLLIHTLLLLLLLSFWLIHGFWYFYDLDTWWHVGHPRLFVYLWNQRIYFVPSFWKSFDVKIFIFSGLGLNFFFRNYIIITIIYFFLNLALMK